MNSRAILLAELEEKSRKNKSLDKRADGLQASESGFAEGYDPYDNPGIHKTARVDETGHRRVIRRR